MSTPVDPTTLLRDFLDGKERRSRFLRITALAVVAILAASVAIGMLFFSRHISAAMRLQDFDLEADLYRKEGGLFAGWGSAVVHHVAVQQWSYGRSPKQTISIEDLRRLKDLINVETVELVDCAWVTDERVAVIAELPGLLELNLQSGDESSRKPTGALTDACLDKIAGLKKLRFLSLAGHRITDAGLARLAGLTELEELDLDRTRVTGKGLAGLGPMPRLKTIRVARTKVTPEEMQEFQRTHPDVVVFRLVED